MLTKDELLMGRDKKFPKAYNDTISKNLDKTLGILNQVRAAYGKPMYVNSGWRPPEINEATSNAAHGSNHLWGLACDFKDDDGSLWKWCMFNLALLQKLGIYLEDKRWTPTWVHMQIVPPGSKKRIYVPSAEAARSPTIWDGKYDAKFDMA